MPTIGPRLKLPKKEIMYVKKSGFEANIVGRGIALKQGLERRFHTSQIWNPALWLVGGIEKSNGCVT